MKLSTRGRYAVTAMIDILLYGNGQAVSLNEISQRQSISVSYLEQLFSKLRKADLVTSIRGPGGGYKIARPLADVKISEILLAVNEVVDARKCKGKGNCKQGTKCLTHDLWQRLTDQVQLFLQGISLQDLVQDVSLEGHMDESSVEAVTSAIGLGDRINLSEIV